MSLLPAAYVSATGSVSSLPSITGGKPPFFFFCRIENLVRGQRAQFLERL
jgi:hypothetical protein